MEQLRTCLACRKSAHKDELCRFVRALDGEICFDDKAVLPHRGAWLCADVQCFKKAVLKRMLFRGEKTLPVKAENMIETVRTRLQKGALLKLSFMRRLGHVEAGKDAVLRLVQQEKVSVVLVAKDFSLRSYKDVSETVSKGCVRMISSSFLMDEIGQTLGRKKTGVVGLLKSRITDEIVMQLNKLSKLETTA